MSSVVDSIKKIFVRKKEIPLACSMTLENEPDHVHTDACFIDVQPLAIVEFFSSQGCQSCPPAIPKIHEAIKKDFNLLLLTYNVTYFNNNEWTDTFSNKNWDQRQRAYVTKWARNNIFTPQIIVNGLADGTGNGTDEVQSIVSAARHIRKTMDWNIIVDTNDVELRIDSDKMQLGQDEGVYDILLIMYEPDPTTVKVKKGANKGKKIEHRNVVRSVNKVGEWMGGNLTLPLPELALGGRHPGLEFVAVVQAGMGGGIVASQRV